MMVSKSFPISITWLTNVIQALDFGELNQKDEEMTQNEQHILSKIRSDLLDEEFKKATLVSSEQESSAAKTWSRIGKRICQGVKSGE